MRVAAVIDDLILYSRIDAAASAAGASLLRVDDPSVLAADLDLVLVDWSARAASWTDALRALRDAGTRVVLFGRHTDLQAHAAAHSAGLGPMWARSKLVGQISSLVVSGG